MTIYYLGGSPCSGKSTVAEALAARYGLRYFKVDDHLDRYMALAVGEGKPHCAAVAGMTADEIWLRDPDVQCAEELAIYEELFPYVQADLAALEGPQPVITEGAAFLPGLMQSIGVPADRYLSVTPTKDFQVSHYRQRPWVPYVLADCTDKERAFDNWMERDALFADAVRQQCRALGYASLVNDGSLPIEGMIARIAAHFRLHA